MFYQISRRTFLIKTRRQSPLDKICVNYEASENSLFLEVCNHWRDARQSPCASARWQMSAEGRAELHLVRVPAELAKPGSLGEVPVPLILLAARKLGVDAIVFH